VAREVTETEDQHQDREAKAAASTRATENPRAEREAENTARPRAEVNQERAIRKGRVAREVTDNGDHHREREAISAASTRAVLKAHPEREVAATGTKYTTFLG
jgi:hypothetical protein